MRPRENIELMQGRVCNLSTGGMFIETVLPLEVGTVFDVEVPMQPLNYIGPVKVLWTRTRDEGPDNPYGMAVEWIDLTVNQKRLLYRQIDDYVRGGGKILGGDPEKARDDRSSAGGPGGDAAAAPDRTKLVILGLVVAVVVLLVVVVVLL